ncbi:MAG: FxsA protein [Gammaproteobacteria bacterium]|jgi:UPF0716 protein FxsA|nr:FxsA protein [Gammaproteobacteria bacterium]
MSVFKLLSLVWIILELIVFFWVAHVIGLGWAILLVVFSSLIGGVLMRRFGLANLQKAQLKMMQGESPTHEMLSAVAIMMGGIFMIVPGFISSIIGLFLLVPKLRDPIANWILRKSSLSMFQQTPHGPNEGLAREFGNASAQPETVEGSHGRTIEGEAWKEQ